MARKTYQLTDETFQVLSKNEAAIAREMECDPSYINKIKNGVELDRHAFYRELFRAAAGAGAPVNIWLNDLTAIYTRSLVRGLTPVKISQYLVEKTNADAAGTSEILKSLEDGSLDKADCHRVLAALEKEKEINSQIERLVLKILGDISEAKQ